MSKKYRFETRQLHVGQTVGLGVLWKRLSADDGVPTSRWADPWMGVTLLGFALVSAGGVRRQGRRTLVILRPTWG